MKQTIQIATDKIVRRVFILNVLLLCCAVFYLNESPVEASSACFEEYELCHNNCDVLYDPQQFPTANANCHSGCLGPYGNCVNEAELKKEGEIISLYDEGQPMPLLQNFRLCIQGCTRCWASDYPSDPAGLQACTENYLACKTACIAQF